MTDSPGAEAGPPALRAWLRSPWRAGRDVLQRLEARVRARLPPRWGGPIADEQLVARQLTDADRAGLTQLRAAAPELFEHAAVSGVHFFGVGLFLRDALVAAGFCRALGPAEQPYERALFYADFVTARLRRRHLGRALHRARLEQLRLRAAQQVFAWVEPHNGAARASLYACGFEETAREPIWGEPSVDHILLRCELEP